jgi:hypothetical protein
LGNVRKGEFLHFSNGDSWNFSKIRRTAKVMSRGNCKNRRIRNWRVEKFSTTIVKEEKNHVGARRWEGKIFCRKYSCSRGRIVEGEANKKDLKSVDVQMK